MCNFPGTFRLKSPRQKPGNAWERLGTLRRAVNFDNLGKTRENLENLRTLRGTGELRGKLPEATKKTWEL